MHQNLAIILWHFKYGKNCFIVWIPGHTDQLKHVFPLFPSLVPFGTLHYEQELEHHFDLRNFANYNHPTLHSILQTFRYLSV